MLDPNPLDFSIIAQQDIPLSSVMNLHNKLSASTILNYTDSTGRSLVHEFCIYNNIKGLKELVAMCGKNCLNSVDKFNTSCAHFASRNGNIEILQYLYEKGFSKWNEKEKRFNLTPLKLSISMKHHQSVHFLLTHASLQSINESLISSVQEGNFEYFNLFLEKGASINFIDPEVGYSPLLWAARNGYLEIVKALIEKGADINLGALEDGYSPLSMVSEKGNAEIARYLIQHGANLNQRTTDAYGYTPLFIATRREHVDVVKELIASGVNINQGTSDNNTTPLLVACQFRISEIAKILMEHGANVNQATTDFGWSPLLTASQKGFVDITKELLEKGANVNQTKIDGSSPLFLASQFGNYDLVLELLKRGADVNLTKKGISPLFIASQEGFLPIVQELVNHGADINITCFDHSIRNRKETLIKGNKYFFTPLYVAYWNEHKNVAAFLKPLSDKKLNIQLATLQDHKSVLNYLSSEK